MGLKKIVLLNSLVALSVCFGKPIRSNLGGECQTYVEDGIVIPANPTAADYVQDGLCIMWDGIENVDWGEHSDDITTWTDLIGGLTIPNVVVVDGVAIDHTKNGYSKNFTRIRDIVSSAYMTFEIASLDQEVWSNSWQQRSRNGGTEWAPSLYSTWSYFSWFRKYLFFPADTNFPNTRSLSADGETVRGYCGGKFYSDCSVEEPHIDEGRCLFYTGVKICCVRFYNRPLSEEEIKYNNLIDKIRFGL